MKCEGVAVARARLVPHLSRYLSWLRVRALGVIEAREKRRRREMRKARGAKKAPSPWDLHSDKKLREASSDLLRCAEDGGAAPRARKKAYKPPDVRSIFGRRGEGHEFREAASEGWCDVCCAIIFQGGLMCTGEAGGGAWFYSIIPSIL